MSRGWDTIRWRSLQWPHMVGPTVHTVANWAHAWARSTSTRGQASMLTEQDRKLILQSWRLVVPIAETAGDLFYRRLFELKPEYRSLFRDDLSKQKRKLVGMLAFIVKSMDWLASEWREEVPVEEDLAMVVMAMGRRHAELYRIPDESYATVGEALLWTLDQGLGPAFTDEVRSAWTRLYEVVSLTMRMGASAARVDINLGLQP